MVETDICDYIWATRDNMPELLDKKEEPVVYLPVIDYEAYERFSFGFTDFRGIFGSFPTT